MFQAKTKKATPTNRARSRVKGDAQRKATARALDRDLTIRPVKEPNRRAEAEADDELWLRTYLPGVFYDPFAAYQVELIRDCRHCLLYGVDKCRAAPRGGGKSSIVKGLSLKYSLTRQVSFPLVIGATATKAKESLSGIQNWLTRKTMSPLLEDYPLECMVAQYVNPAPLRARNVTGNGGRPIRVEWGAEWFTIPTWEDEEPLGPILRSIGWSSDGLQGLNVFDVRPDFVLLDDLDSRDSLAAEDGVVAAKIEECIDKNVAGLGGLSKRLGKFFLCTITSRKSAAYKYSDPKEKQWSGKRIPAILKMPDRMDLWETFMEMFQRGKSTLDDNGDPTDEFGRNAFHFYEDNFEVMNAGAKTSNPYNYERDLLPDGTPTHLSALQKCFEYIAKNGMESFQTEHQQDPPQKEEHVDSGITAHRVQRQVNGFERFEVPKGCVVIVQGIDVAKRRLHYVVKAFRADGTGFIIDYGVYDVTGESKTAIGEELAIKRAILGRIEESREAEYVDANGEILPIDLTLVDAGYKPKAVYAACKEAGLGVRALKGCGKSNGTAQMRYPNYRKETETEKPGGDAWCETREHKKYPWLILVDSDYWKAWEHDRWMTTPTEPASMTLFGERGTENRDSADQKSHHTFSHHIDAEKEVEEIVKGILKRYWKKTPGRGNNHYLDASAYANAAANMKGIRLLKFEEEKTRKPPQERQSIKQMMESRKRKTA